MTFNFQDPGVYAILIMAGVGAVVWGLVKLRNYQQSKRDQHNTPAPAGE